MNLFPLWQTRKNKSRVLSKHPRLPLVLFFFVGTLHHWSALTYLEKALLAPANHYHSQCNCQDSVHRHYFTHGDCHLKSLYFTLAATFWFTVILRFLCLIRFMVISYLPYKICHWVNWLGNVLKYFILMAMFCNEVWLYQCPCHG